MIASSGAGKVEHFSEVFVKTKAEAALASGIFHREEVDLLVGAGHFYNITNSKIKISGIHYNIEKLLYYKRINRT